MPKKLSLIRISQTRDIDIQTVPYVETHAVIEKGKDEPQFDINSVFRLKVLSGGPLSGIRNNMKARKPAVIWIDGKTTCEKLQSKDGELLEPITNADRKNIVKREIAKVLANIKPMKGWMFGALLATCVIIIILQLLLLGGVRFR